MMGVYSPRNTSSRDENVIQSQELRKLLSCNAPLSSQWYLFQNTNYNADVMIDELYISQINSNESSQTGVRKRSDGQISTGNIATSSFSSMSFTQQTNSFTALKSTFHHTLQQLIHQRESLSQKINELEKETTNGKEQYQASLIPPEARLDKICSCMEELDDRFSKVNSIARSVGDRLSILDAQRLRAIECEDFLDALTVLNDPLLDLNAPFNTKSSLVNSLKVLQPENLHTAIHAMKKLRDFASQVTSKSLSVATQAVERLSGTIEGNILLIFSEAQEKNDEGSMKESANSLITFNGHEKVADRYVWNIMRVELANEALIGSINPQEILISIDQLLAKILTICKVQFPIIQRIFPAKLWSTIIELLLERLFLDPAFGIYSHVDQIQYLLTKQSSMSSSMTLEASNNLNETLELLCTAHDRVWAFSSDITNLDVSIQRNPCSANQNQSILQLDECVRLQVYALFGNYYNRYCMAEQQYLETRLRIVIDSIKWPQSAKATAKQVKNLEKKSKKDHGTDVSIIEASNTSFAISHDTSMTGTRTIAEVTQVHIEQDILCSAAQNVDTQSIIENCLQLTISRSQRFLLAGCNENFGEFISQIVSLVVKNYGNGYLLRLAGLANDILELSGGSLQNMISYFHVFQYLQRSILSFDSFMMGIIDAVLHNFPSQFKRCSAFIQECLSTLETIINTSLQFILSMFQKRLKGILTTTLDKSDYICKSSNVGVTSPTVFMQISNTCRHVSSMLQSLVMTISQSMTKDENQDKVLLALAQVFHRIYLLHLQRLRFDPDGACLLLQDIQVYQQSFTIPQQNISIEILELFEELKLIANLFALPPESLSGFVKQGKLSSISIATVQELIKRRWDYKTHIELLTLS